jgi:hypothetical protein
MDTKHWAFKPILLFVSIGSFLISWIFTCNLLASMATTGFATVIAFGLATVLEPAKIVFMALGTSQRDLMALIVGICLTLLSIVGTIGFLQVQHAEKLAMQTQSSAGFQGLQSQISGMDSQIANIQTAANALPTNYHSRRQQLLDEANAMLAQKNELTQQLATYSPSTGEASNAMYNALSVFFGGLNPMLIELWINSIYGILLELVAIISGIYVFKNSGFAVSQVQATRQTGNRQDRPQSFGSTSPAGVLDEPDQDDYYEPQSQPQKQTVKAYAGGVGFTAQNRGNSFDSQQLTPENTLSIDTDTFYRYIDARYDTENEFLLGNKAASVRCRIEPKDGLKFHNILKDLGVIHVDANNSYPKVDRAMAKQKVNQWLAEKMESEVEEC